MVQDWIKLINKSGKREELLNVINKILDGNFDGLDIKRIAGEYGYLRCRVGKIRIIFCQKDGKRYIDRVGYRGDIYK